LEQPIFGIEHLDPDKFPNLILLEYCINSNSDPLTATLLDRLIQFIKEKWKTYKARNPSFMILETWCIGGGMEYDTSDKSLETPEGRLERLNHNSEHDGKEMWKDIKTNIKALPGMFHLNVARFYKIPYISVTDALFPAYTRHYIHHNISNIWDYNPPGCHMSFEGWKYVADKIIIPFLIEQLNNNKDDEMIANSIKKMKHHKDIRNIYDHKLLLHHPIVYDNHALEFWGTWSVPCSDKYADNYKRLFPPTAYWNHTIPPHYQHEHYGFCSYTKDTHAKGNIVIIRLQI
jgi:hypothetical protein